MKALIVSFYYTPEIGAAPSRITNMAGGLQKEGIDVDILTCLPNYPKGKIFDGYRGRLYKKETINNVRIYRYWTYATVSKSSIARILGMLFFAMAIWIFGLKFWKVLRYDRVIIQSPPLMVAYSAMMLFRCLYRRSTILNISDLWPLSAIELGAVKEGSLYCKILQYMERFLYRNASAYQGQSQEIINHIQAFGYDRPCFLYRNLQPLSVAYNNKVPSRDTFKIVYAGLLGLAQDILSIVKNINFKEVGAELHIYGGGNQTLQIQQYVKEHDCGIIFHGYQPKEFINTILGHYNASIVPLSVRIKGAVPSKIFDLLPHGTPILFAGGGEGENIITTHGFGFVSPPGDCEMLKCNIIKMKEMPADDYRQLRLNCIEASLREFSFEQQKKKYKEFVIRPIRIPKEHIIRIDMDQAERIKSEEDEGFISDGMNALERNMKRISDCIFASCALVILSPALLCCYIAVKWEDGGPVIFKQERIGRFGRPFTIFKFRSMKLDAEKFGPALFQGQENDPRLTKVGRFLRMHHLDELPQLWNIVRGDMAFVGPRPERKFYIKQIEEKDPRYYMLYQIRPGVTSYATLYNGYTDTIEKMVARLRYDLFYLEHRSWAFDFMILLKTFAYMVSGKKF